MIKKLLLVNSKDRSDLSYSSSDFNVQFNRAFQNIRSVQLLSYEIANTIYNINNNNNKLKFTENTGASTIIATLTNGSYSSSSLASHIASVMTANTANGITYTTVYQSTTFKFLTIASILNFRFDFTNAYNPYLQMGYDEGQITSYATTSTSTNAIRLDICCGLLEIDILNNIETTSPSVNCSWLLEIPGAGNVQSKYINSTYFHSLDVSSSTLRSMNIRIKDMNNKTLDFNGSNCVFLFELTMN